MGLRWVDDLAGCGTVTAAAEASSTTGSSLSPCPSTSTTTRRRVSKGYGGSRRLTRYEGKKDAERVQTADWLAQRVHAAAAWVNASDLNEWWMHFQCALRKSVMFTKILFR